MGSTLRRLVAPRIRNFKSVSKHDLSLSEAAIYMQSPNESGNDWRAR